MSHPHFCHVSKIEFVVTALTVQVFAEPDPAQAWIIGLNLSARETYRFVDRHRERADGINLDVMLIAGKASLLAHWLDAEKRSLPYAEQLMRAREWLRARGVGFDQRASRWATWMLPTQVCFFAHPPISPICRTPLFPDLTF